MQFRDESELRKKVMSDLSRLGYLTYAIPDSRWQLGDKGYPDVTAAGRGFIAFIECKMPGKYLRADQTTWRDEIMSALEELQTASDECGFEEALPVDHFTVWPSNWRDTKTEHFMSELDRQRLCHECLDPISNTTDGKRLCVNNECSEGVKL